MPATDAVTGKATYFSKYDIIRDNYKIIEDIDHRHLNYQASIDLATQLETKEKALIFAPEDVKLSTQTVNPMKMQKASELRFASSDAFLYSCYYFIFDNICQTYLRPLITRLQRVLSAVYALGFCLTRAVSLSPSVSMRIVSPSLTSSARISFADNVSTCFCKKRFNGLAP